MPARRERRRAIEYSDVVETEKTALEDVGAIRIFAVDPPSEVEKQFVKDFFKECAVADATDSAFNFVDAPGGPGVNGRIDVAKSPFVGGKLAVRMHVPFAKQKNKLLFREIGIDESERNAMESEIPRGIPGIFPFVRHGDDVIVVEMRPILVAAFFALGRRRGTSRVSFQPGLDVVVLKLF